MSLRSSWSPVVPVAHLMLIAFVASLLVAQGQARAGDKSGALTAWIVTEGGEAVGRETLRVVRGDSGSLFASGELEITEGKHKAHRVTHLQRNADGKLMKYRRVEVVRKGKGVFAFDRKGGLRIVSVNTDGKPHDLGDKLDRYLWDPKVWSHLGVLALQLDGATKTLVLPYVDVEAKKTGSATLGRQGLTHVLDKDGHEVEVRTWALQSGPGAPLTLFVAPGGRLVGVKGQHRAMLLDGWRWAPSAPAPVLDEPTSGESSGNKADVVAPAGEAGEGGVGP